MVGIFRSVTRPATEVDDLSHRDGHDLPGGNQKRVVNQLQFRRRKSGANHAKGAIFYSGSESRRCNITARLSGPNGTESFAVAGTLQDETSDARIPGRRHPVAGVDGHDWRCP